MEQTCNLANINGGNSFNPHSTSSFNPNFDSTNDNQSKKSRARSNSSKHQLIEEINILDSEIDELQVNLISALTKKNKS